MSNKDTRYANKVATINAEDKLTIYISEDVNRLFKILHNEYLKEERSWIWKVEMINWQPILTDIYFPEQTNTWWDTEFTSKWAEEMIEYIFDNDPVDCDKRNCWIHSHHSMWCFWSHTDAEQQINFNNWLRTKMYSIVTSWWDWEIKYKWRLNIYKPIEFQLDISVKSIDDDYCAWNIFYWEIEKEYKEEKARNLVEYYNKNSDLKVQTRYDLQWKQWYIWSDDEELMDRIVEWYSKYNSNKLLAEKNDIDSNTKQKYYDMLCSQWYIWEKISQLKNAIIIPEEKEVKYYWSYDDIKINNIINWYDMETAYLTLDWDWCIYNEIEREWTMIAHDEYLDLLLQYNTNNNGTTDEIQESDLNI